MKKFSFKSALFQAFGLSVLVLGLFVSTKLVGEKTNFQNRASTTCSSISTDSEAGVLTCNRTFGCMATLNQCTGTSLSQCNHIGCSTVPITRYCRPEYVSETACKSTVAASHGCRPGYSAQTCYGISSSNDSFCSSFASSSKTCSSPATGGKCRWGGRYTGCNGQWTTEQCQGQYYSCISVATVCSPNQIRCSGTGSASYQKCTANGSAWVNSTCASGKICFNADAYHSTTGCYYP